jgi:hypothetical protein
MYSQFSLVLRAVLNRIFFWQSTATPGYFADVSQFPNRFVLELAVGESLGSRLIFGSRTAKNLRLPITIFNGY